MKTKSSSFLANGIHSHLNHHTLSYGKYWKEIMEVLFDTRVGIQKHIHLDGLYEPYWDRSPRNIRNPSDFNLCRHARAFDTGTWGHLQRPRSNPFWFCVRPHSLSLYGLQLLIRHTYQNPTCLQQNACLGVSKIKTQTLYQSYMEIIRPSICNWWQQLSDLKEEESWGKEPRVGC